MFRVIRIKRVSVDLPAGHVVDFNGNRLDAAKDVCDYLWGKDINNYLVIKLGNELSLPSSELSEIYKYLLEA